MINSENDNDKFEIDIKKVYISLKKEMKWLLIIPIGLTLIALMYVLIFAQSIYTSEAKILLSGNDNNQSSLRGLVSQFGLSIPSASDDLSYLSVETLPEILKSRTLTNIILFSNFETNKSESRLPLFSIIYDHQKVSQSDSNRLIAQGEKYIAEEVLSSKLIKNTNIYYIYVNSTEPQLSKQIADMVLVELERLQSDFSIVEIGLQKEFIVGRINEIQNELYQTESLLKNFREQNLQINLSPSLLLEQERLERDIRIQTEIFISLKQEFENIKIKEKKKNTYLKIIDEPNIPVAPSKPKKRLIVLSMGILGIFFSCTYAIIKNYKN